MLHACCCFCFIKMKIFCDKISQKIWELVYSTEIMLEVELSKLSIIAFDVSTFVNFNKDFRIYTWASMYVRFMWKLFSSMRFNKLNNTEIQFDISIVCKICQNMLNSESLWIFSLSLLHVFTINSNRVNGTERIQTDK